MPHAAVKAYKQVLVLLETQQVLSSQTDSPSACTQLDKVTTAIDEQVVVVFSITGVPRAAWKTIIKDMEVPRRVATLCCQRQLSSSGQGDQVWVLLDVLLSSATQEVFAVSASSTADRTSASQNDTSTLRRCMAQQLQQAGMFAHYPTVMLAAAQLLQAETDTIAAVHSAAAATTTQGSGVQDRTSSASGGASSSGGNSSGDNSSGENSSGRTSGSSSSAAQQARRGGNLSSAAGSAYLPSNCALLLAIGHLLFFLQDPDSAVGCSTVAATAVLSLSAVRFLDVAAGREGPAGLRSWSDPVLSELAQKVALSLAHITRSLLQCTADGSRNQQLLQSKDVGSAVDLAVLLLHAHSLLPAQQQPTTGSSSNSGGDPLHTSSTSGSAGVSGDAELIGRLVATFLDPGAVAKQQRAWQAWDVARQLETGRQGGLDEPLLQSLGIRLRTVGWMAAYVPDTAYQLWESTARAVRTITHVRWALKPVPEESALAGISLDQLAATAGVQRGLMSESLQQLSHTLLGVQLLLLAAQRQREQQQQSGAAWVAPCSAATETAMHVAVCAQEDWGMQLGQWEQFSPLLAPWARREFWQVLHSWVGGAMPVVLQLMAGLQQEADSVTAAHAATTDATGNSSSSSSTSSTHLAYTSAPPAPGFGLIAEVIAEALTYCAVLLCMMGSLERTFRAPPGNASSSTADPSVSLPWLQHSAAVSAALEGVRRKISGC